MVTRHEIQIATGYDPVTITRAIKHLIYVGVLARHDKPRPDRRSHAYSLV